MKTSILVSCSILLADAGLAMAGGRYARAPKPRAEIIAIAGEATGGVATADATTAREAADGKVTPAEIEGNRAIVSAVESKFASAWEQQQRRRSRYSRARMPPTEVRTRLRHPKPETDGSGAAYYTFEIVSRPVGSECNQGWERELSGCFYPAEGEIYVKRGDDYRTAESFLGKKGGKAPAGACSAGTMAQAG